MRYKANFPFNDPFPHLPCEAVGFCIYPKCIEDCNQSDCKSLCHTKMNPKWDYIFEGLEPDLDEAPEDWST